MKGESDNESVTSQSKAYPLYVTKYLDLEDQLSITETDLAKDPPPSLSSLQLHDQALSDAYDAFKAYYAACESEISEERLDEVGRKYRVLKRSAIRTLSELKSLIDAKLDPSTNAVPTPSPSVPAKQLPQPKLPEIKVPVFSGELSQWNPFWDSFCSLIDSRQDIDAVIKFTLLRTYLRGAAFKTVEGLAITSSNYSVALQLLKSRFADETRLLQQLHLDLLNIQSPAHNLSELTEFRLTFEKLLLQIETLTKSPCRDYLIKDIVAKRLAPKTLQFLYNKYDTFDLTLLQIKDGIGHIIKSMEYSQSLSDQSVKPNNKNDDKVNTQPKPKSSNPSTITKQVAVLPKSDKSVPKPANTQSIPEFSWSKSCIFCNQIHSSKYCNKYSTFDGRRDRVRELDLCFKCLKKGHRAAVCTVKPECRNCNGAHHTFLCLKLLNHKTAVNQGTVTISQSVPKNSEPVSKSDPVTEDLFEDFSQVTLSHVVNSVQTVVNSKDECMLAPTALPTAIAQLSGAGVRQSTRVFLDTGAQRTFIHSALAQRLNLKPVSRISLKLTTFSNETQHLWCDVVRLVVRIGVQRFVIYAVVYDEVNTNLHAPGLTRVVETLKDRGIKLADPCITSDNVSDIGLVIGADYFARFVTNISCHSGVTLLTSPAGSIIFGSIPKWAVNPQSVGSVQAQRATCLRVGIEILDSELDQVENLWSLDVVGIKSETFTPEETQSLYHFESTCKKVENQYFVELPFKSDERPASNYRRAFGQLMSLGKSFTKHPELHDQYSQIVREYEDLGFVEKVENPVVMDGLSHYLPHHPVFKKSDTTPIRIVFNASSKTDSNSKSLNECLLTGPSLTTKLVDSLVEFRTNPVAAVADISKAFLRIGILPHCRDFCRFLWFEDETLEKIATYRFRVVLFGATSSPFLLQKTLAYHLEKHPNELAKSLIPHFYVDNFVCTYSDTDQLRRAYPQVNSILSDASMPLQGWISNSVEFNQELGIDLDEKNIEHINVLGLSWNVVSDELSLYRSSKVCKGECMHHHITKRLVVSVISAPFDPLGLLSPVLIKGKLFIQNLWKADYSWDDVISESLTLEFQSICKTLGQISDIQFPRFVVVPKKSDLHIFCDSSQTAYGLAVYVVNLENKSSNLLMSKARVAPNPPLTIPKLELLALTLASRLVKNLLNNNKLSFSNCTVWCDSEVALNWVYHNKSKEVFVRNRVSEIRQLQSEYNLRLLYVPTNQNPADTLTRGVTVSQLSKNLLWKHGPLFLLDSSAYPPQKEFLFSPVVVGEILTEPTVVEQDVPVFDMTRFSSLTRVMGIMSVIMQFCKIYVPSKFKLNSLHACVRLAQLQSFPTLHKYLAQPEQIPNPPEEVKNLVKQLDLFLSEDQLICCNSRMQNSDLSHEAQFPIYLPAKHPLTKLIITHYHVTNHHCGLGSLVICIRQQFWISKARVIIKNILSKCILCRKTVGRNIPQPGPPPLPEERVKYIRPFNSVGIDFTGTINVYTPSDIEDVPIKTYVCLFTCTVTRAVHLELCNSLSTSEFLLALRRFCAKFGVPSLIISDNGTNFRGAERFLVDIQDEPEVRSYLKNTNIVWKFLTPRSPWSGGFFERMISTVKTCLHKCLYRKRVSFSELQSLLCEIQTIVNSRPLTYLSEDIRDDYLSPSHLLYGRSVSLLPPLNSFGADVPYGEYLDLRVQYARLSEVLSKFERDWKSSYLTSLKEKHLNCARMRPCEVKEGDLVLLELDNLKRSQYPLGLVIRLIPSADNVTRSAVVRASGTEYVRPLSKLIPLELHHELVPEVQPVIPPDPVPMPAAPPRPKRHAAQRAENLRRDLIDADLL